MTVKLNECLYNMLKEGLFRIELFVGKDIDELLDLRDAKEFDEKWMEVYKHMECLRDEIKDRKLINDIRKEAFFKANILSNSSELAGYVSDDFELISEALEIGYNDEWLNGLFNCYLSRTFPCGEMRMYEKDLASQVVNYLKEGA